MVQFSEPLIHVFLSGIHGTMVGKFSGSWFVAIPGR
jgi:hypothetical protein